MFTPSYEQETHGTYRDVFLYIQVDRRCVEKPQNFHTHDEMKDCEANLKGERWYMSMWYILLFISHDSVAEKTHSYILFLLNQKG